MKRARESENRADDEMKMKVIIYESVMSVRNGERRKKNK